MRNKLAPTVWFLSLAALLVASPTWAQSVFVIQLGTFPNKQEAEQKWGDLKKAQPDVLSGLSMHVAEAILQPDNVTLYRTQAGPFRNKIDAQTACGKLKAAKSECLVAETALFVPDQPPSKQIAAQPATPPVSLPALGMATSTSTASVTPPPLPPELPLVSKAATEEKIAAAAPAPTTTASAPEKSSGWFSWMHNPFSSNEEEARTAQPPSSAPYALASAPITNPVQQAANAPESAHPGQTVFYGVAEPKSENSAKPWMPNANDDKPAQNQTLAALAPVATPTPTVAKLHELAASGTATGSPAAGSGVAQETAAAIANPQPVPPPMAPAQPTPSFDSAFPATPGAAPITIRAKNLEAEPAEMAATPAEPQPASPAAPWFRGNAHAGDKAQVKVAEAIHVPLSSGRIVTSANPASFRGMPSQNLGMRSYWAQLSYFSDDRSALDFWQGFSASRPEFSGMRLRLVRPYLTRGRAVKTSLRVGPFENADNVNNLCAAASARGLRCYSVADMGYSATANAPRNRAPVPLRYQTSSTEMGMTGYWVQLGTYRSAHEAEETWEQLKDTNSDLLKKVGSKISVPALSSSPQAKYRLRAGPFSSDMGASDLCRKLKFRNVGCLVVSGQ